MLYFQRTNFVLHLNNCEIVLNKFLVDCLEVLMIVPTGRLGSFLCQLVNMQVLLLQSSFSFLHSKPVEENLLAIVDTVSQ